MGFLIGLFTLVMILDCIILVFLVLIQLPKKEAGAGLAFGASATDALFGAGSGTVLTKITKYSAGIFFVLAVVLSVMQSFYHSRAGTSFTNKLGQPPPQFAPAAVPPSPSTSTNAATLNVPATTNPAAMTPEAAATNTPPAVATTNTSAAPSNAAPKQ